MSSTIRNLGIAIALMLLGIWLTFSYIQGQKRSITRGTQEITVLVAKKDIPAGTKASTLEDGDYVEQAHIRRGDAPPQALYAVSDVAKLSSNTTIYRGEVLTIPKFERNSGLSPSDQIKGDQRWFSLAINPPASVTALVRPGDHVDFVASREVDQKVITWIVARDVLVTQTPSSMASDTDSEEGSKPISATGDPLLYTFQASDHTAQDLMWAAAAANDKGLQMLLRPSNDSGETKLPQLSAPNPKVD